MFRERVAKHYRQRGYEVQEATRVRGDSGAVHACDLVVQGPLGNLVVDIVGPDGPDDVALSSVRRKARDVGATPVLAAPRIRAPVRHAAARLGVVLLDQETLEENPPQEEADSGTDDPLAGHPWPEHARKEAVGAWPAPGRHSGTASGSGAAANLWRRTRSASEEDPAPQEASAAGRPGAAAAGAQPPAESGGEGDAATEAEPFAWLRGARDAPRAPSRSTTDPEPSTPQRTAGTLIVERPRPAPAPQRHGVQESPEAPDHDGPETSLAPSRQQQEPARSREDPLGSSLRSVLESRKRSPPPTVRDDPAADPEPAAPDLVPEAEQSATLRSRTRRPARLTRRRPQVPVTRAQAIQAAVWGAAAGVAGGATFWLLSLLL